MMSNALRIAFLLAWPLLAAHVFAQSQPPDNAVSAQNAVSALGRLEPEHGIVRVSAPSMPEAILGAVLTQLLVEEGADVQLGQLLAVIDTAKVLEAVVHENEVALEFSRQEVESVRSRAREACVRADVAASEANRRQSLRAKGLAGEEEAESALGEAEALEASCESANTATRSAETAVKVALAKLERAKAEADRAYIRAPMDGRVLAISVRPGELIDIGGILELGRVDRMYAIAEVYETDIRRVRIGQRARISSSALQGDLEGTVERIRQKVNKQDQIGTDPAAQKDARIIEVEILLDDSAPVAALTNLQVDVVITP
jgi:HlyD family secretion protein